MNFNLTLLGQSIAFVLFVLFCMRYVWPPVITALRDRQQTISDGLSAADAAQQKLKQAEEQAVEKREQAKQRSAEILADANRRAEQIIEKTKGQANEEILRAKRAHEAELEQEINRVKEDLRKELGALIVAGVKQVMGKEVDPKAHKQLIKQLASSL